MSTVLKNFSSSPRWIGYGCTALLACAGGIALAGEKRTESVHLSYWMRSGIGQLEAGNYQQALQDFNQSLEQENNLPRPTVIAV
jgi:Tfp pilus assembly protein PilF